MYMCPRISSSTVRIRSTLHYIEGARAHSDHSNSHVSTLHTHTQTHRNNYLTLLGDKSQRTHIHYTHALMHICVCVESIF